MNAKDIIDKYIEFFKKRGHKQIANAPLVPENDPTTLFTSSGMQPLVHYLLGEPHPMGKRLVNVQNCFRAQDIDEIGDNRHTTFFRMLGNWSLGDYTETQKMKESQLSLFFTFLTNKTEGLNLDPNKLYVTVYAGEGDQFVETKTIKEILGPDKESIKIWKDLFFKKSITAEYLDLKDFPSNVTQDEINKARIFSYGSNKNWWSRSGIPEKMPIGEPGGPDSEVFYDFGVELKFHENSIFNNKPCHPNCDCGRFLEIGNSVFMQYKKTGENTFEPLPNINVDFGGGLERLLAATEKQPDIFKTQLFRDLREKIISSLNQKLNNAFESMVRIFLDHSQASIFLISSNVIPSKNDRGYVLRRLIRRADDQLTLARLDNEYFWKEAIDHFTRVNQHISDIAFNRDFILETIIEELKKYGTVFKNFDKEKKELLDVIYSYPTNISTASQVAGPIVFKYQSSFGIPYGTSENLIKELKLSPEIVRANYLMEMEKHINISRAGAAKKFAGGLADHSEKTIMGHTATHLLHKALRDMFGEQLHQTGSNITSERIRFDFNYDKNLTPEQIKKIEEVVNEKIRENLPVHFEMLPLQKAKEIGAIGLFDEKYSENVKVYFVGDYSKEFCGGPHVAFTSEIKSFKIIKQENIGKGNRRIYAKVG